LGRNLVGGKPRCENIHEMADRPRAALGLAIAMAAFGATGCGASSTQTAAGSASSSPGASKSIASTKTQFIAQTESICHKLSSQEKPLEARQESLKRLPAASSEKTFVSLASQVVTLSRSAARQLRALPRPPGEAEKIEELLTAYDEEVTSVANIAYSAAHQESSAGEAAEATLKRSIATNSGLAREFGLKDCIGS
jgi:hypothetical protein